MLAFLFRYSVAIFAGLISALSLFLIHRFPIFWVFVLISVLLLGLTVLLSFLVGSLVKSKINTFVLKITSIIASIGLLSLIGSNWLRLFLIVFGGILIGLLFAVEIYQEHSKHYDYKPIRRMLMMLWVFDAYALSTTILALSVFFSSISFWIWALAASFVFGGATLMIWQLYFNLKPKFFLFWALILVFAMFEFLWVIHIFPFGYLVSGMLVTWLWYVLQLFVRFHLGKHGVIWRRQRTFLIVNAVLYAGLLLFVVRWI